MKHSAILWLAFLWLSNAQAGTMNCRATFTKYEGSNTTTIELDLEKAYEDTAIIRYEADIERFHFFVQADKKTQTHRLMITEGPNYVDGVTAALTWDNKNQMRLAQVHGDDTLRLLCLKN